MNGLYEVFSTTSLVDLGSFNDMMAWISAYLKTSNNSVDFIPASTAHLRQMFMTNSSSATEEDLADFADAVLVFVNIYLLKNGFGQFSRVRNANRNANIFLSLDGMVTIDFFISFTANTSQSDADAVVKK